MRTSAVGVLSLLLLAAPLRAAPSPEDRKAAKDHFEKGTRYYQVGEFAEAAEEYKLAYKAVPDTVLLYNLGQLYRLAKDYDNAVVYYTSFLASTKDAAIRKEVVGRLAKLDVLIKDKKARETKLAEASKQPSPDGGAPDLAPVAKVEPTPDPNTKPDPNAKPDPSAKPELKLTGNSDRARLLVEVIKQKRQGFRDCFDAWSKLHPSVEGHFVVVLWLQPDGKLEEAEAAANGMQAPDVEKCLVDYAKTLTYPKSAAGRVTKFTYPFNFKPL